MINYAGPCRIPFATKNIKIFKYRIIKKESSQVPSKSAAMYRKKLIRTKINIWNLARLDLANLKFSKFYFTEQHTDCIKLNN